MGLEMLLDAKGEFFDLFRQEEYINTLKGSLNKKEKSITFKPNVDIRKGDKIVRKILKEEFVVHDLDVLIVHQQPFYKKIFYLKETFDSNNNKINSAINITANYAPINTAGGNIESNNAIIINKCNNDINELKKLIDKLVPSINQSELNLEEKEDLKDDLDTVYEQIESDKPKIARLRKAYVSIKDFVVKASKVSGIATLVLKDWEKLIERLQELIKTLS